MTRTREQWKVIFRLFFVLAVVGWAAGEVAWTTGHPTLASLFFTPFLGTIALAAWAVLWP